MNKQRASQLYELADRLSKVDVASLSEQQLADRNSMIAKLQEEVKGVAEGSLAEMDKSAPQPGRDGRVSHSTYGSRDKGGSKGPEREATPITAKKAAQDALDILKKQGVGEGIADNEDQGEYDNEGGMAKDDLSTIEDAATELRSILTTDENLPEWVQAKITKAMDYIDTARDYMKSKKSPVTETKVKPTEFVNTNPKLTAVNIKKTDPVSEEINTEAYERLQKVFAFKNYES